MLQSWQWFSTIGGGGQAINPDIPDEQVADMVTDSAGNVYVCGRFIGQGSPTINGTPITSFGGYDIFVAKFNCCRQFVVGKKLRVILIMVMMP
ncbi:MAG: hypothetical protein IPG39_17220 [Bacteroidetes bacterium]|nr:hypothetical protein [Bacteroidota bacterium]